MEGPGGCGVPPPLAQTAESAARSAAPVSKGTAESAGPTDRQADRQGIHPVYKLGLVVAK